jgi:transcriptional regulator of arginine metabolism
MRETRQRAIREILRARVVATQQELLAALAERGETVDQSTLSRDLHELGIRKSGGRYELPSEEGAPARPDPWAVVRSFAACGPHLIVIRTDVGQAQPVAVTIDARAEAAIAATLAGDDTIFVATKNSRAQKVVLRRLTSWFGDKCER